MAKQLEPSLVKRLVKEHETKTIYVNENHLKPMLKEKFLAGLINPYNISIYSLTQMSRTTIRAYEPLGFKAVFMYEDKSVLLIYNK